MNENSESFDLVFPKIDESKKLKIVIHHTPRGVNEFEYEIPRDDAELLIKKYCSSYLTKRRYTIPHGDLEIELDVFTGSMAGLVIAEIELPTKNTKFDIPEWFGKEITEDRFYSNRSIAARNMKHDD